MRGSGKAKSKVRGVMDPQLWHKDWAHMVHMDSIPKTLLTSRHNFFSSFLAPLLLFRVWQTASLYHLVHTAALLAAPITRHPNVFGGLLTAGIVAFSGTRPSALYILLLLASEYQTFSVSVMELPVKIRFFKSNPNPRPRPPESGRRRSLNVGTDVSWRHASVRRHGREKEGAKSWLLWDLNVLCCGIAGRQKILEAGTIWGLRIHRRVGCFVDGMGHRISVGLQSFP
ncbi:hypothetical protein Cgig2_029253 [Carnegiea gigantea]|uniref:Uncharacterized protein n=1 Tax=Carnegiea gigantea TaxID=171969 RepID=A0A9Q1KS49_9CARY|nr:hypothetical protein Cgig2_029253 [Carnegiea gigantea]